jgi:hypothetical protein
VTVVGLRCAIRGSLNLALTPCDTPLVECAVGSDLATVRSVENYCVRRDYTPRPMPDYFDDMATEDSGVIYQPDVYLRARDIADRLGAWALIDVGAGSGVKLADISNGRHVIALD